MSRARRPWCRPQRTRSPETHAMSGRYIRSAPCARIRLDIDIFIIRPRDRPLLCGPATAHARDGHPIARPRAAVSAPRSTAAAMSTNYESNWATYTSEHRLEPAAGCGAAQDWLPGLSCSQCSDQLGMLRRGARSMLSSLHTSGLGDKSCGERVKDLQREPGDTDSS